jgi:hypothetical protein
MYDGDLISPLSLTLSLSVSLSLNIAHHVRTMHFLAP